MRDLVRHRAEQEALRAGHALVADHDQVGAPLLRDVEDRVGRIALAGVGVDRDPGGLDADIPGDPNCRPGAEPAGRDIYQMTFSTRSVRHFGLPSGYVGTSMAAPHVSATAALVIASGVIGPHPSPAQVEARLKATARDLGTPGPDSRYGAGMVDAARAVTP